MLNLHPVGGIIAAYAFLATDAPRFITGYSLCVGFLCIAIVSCSVYLAGCMWENRRRDKGSSLESSLSTADKQLLGDLNPDYRYLY